MEVKSNLLKNERIDSLKKYRLAHFRKVARVMLGEPNQEFKECILKAKLKVKQAKADAAHLVKIKEKQRKREIEIRALTIEKAKKKAEILKKKAAEEQKRKAIAAATGGEPAPEEDKKDDEDMGDDDVADLPKEEDEPAPKAELTAQEVRELFPPKGAGCQDLNQGVLGSSYSNFTVPQDGEGFDAIEFDWKPKDACEEHMKQWILNRKLTVRIDDIKPSDWFKLKLADWQNCLQSWHAKRVEYNDPAKRAEAMLESNKKKKA